MKNDEYKSRLFLESRRFKRKCSECGKRKQVAYCFYIEQTPSFLNAPVSEHFICQNCGIGLQENMERQIFEEAKTMDEVMIKIPLDPTTEVVLNVIEQAGYVYKGEFRYRVYHEFIQDSWEIEKTELFEKDNNLFYFAGISQGDKISVINIGAVENKRSNNPHCIPETSIN